MNFYSARDLRTMPKQIWKSLDEYKEVVITNNGKPSALMLDIDEDNFEELIQAVRQARAMLTFNAMRSRAAKAGFMSESDIDDEISAYRKEKRERH